jgi:hypothetical protein
MRTGDAPRALHNPVHRARREKGSGTLPVSQACSLPGQSQTLLMKLVEYWRCSAVRAVNHDKGSDMQDRQCADIPQCAFHGLAQDLPLSGATPHAKAWGIIWQLDRRANGNEVELEALRHYCTIL